MSIDSIKPKLCVDCKFFKTNYITSNKFGKCSLFPKEEEPYYNEYELIDGTIKKPKPPDHYFCITARKYDDMCGKEGKKYVKKEKGWWFEREKI